MASNKKSASFTRTILMIIVIIVAYFFIDAYYPELLPDFLKSDKKTEVKTDSKIRYAKDMPDKKDKILFASWNVNNLFDIKDDIGKNDKEYLPPKWTQEKLDDKLKKMTAVVKAISADGPDIFALQEIENIHILTYWVDTYLKDMDYGTVILEEGGDPRGIDVALISKFPAMSHKSHKQTKSSREILETELNVYGNKLLVFNIHHKSRMGGAEQTNDKRVEQSKILEDIVYNSYSSKNIDEVIITGDFNDEPNNDSLISLQAIHRNVFINLMKDYTKLKSNDRGTCYYSKDKMWHIFDQIIVSCGLKEDLCNMAIKGLSISEPKASIYKGEKLKSLKKDHRPIFVNIDIKDINI